VTRNRSAGAFARGPVAVLALVIPLAACSCPAGGGRPAPAPAALPVGSDGGVDVETAAPPDPGDAGDLDDAAAAAAADASPEPEDAEAAWHEPVAEREPATDAARKIVETVQHIADTLTETRYQFVTVVREHGGVFDWDCSGMAAWVLDRAAPRARAALSDDHPVAREFYDLIARSPTDEARHGWQRLASPEEIAPGDVFAWRKPPMFAERPNTGHVGFVLGTPQPHPQYADIWVLRIADSTFMLHEADSRDPAGEGGFGTGTMAFQFDGSGTAVAYGWYGAAQDPQTYVPTEIAFGRVTR
jgi:hypothetical protein